MRSRIPSIGLVVAIAAVALALGASVRGQEPAPSEVMGTLMVELRALRGAIEQLASTGARVQLVVGRLQIQEQRYNALSRQLFEVRQSLAAAERQRAEQEAQLTDLESTLPGTSDRGERQAITRQIGDLKAVLSAGSTGLQTQRLDESELAATVDAEQGRLSDLNQQLDAIEQSLRR